MQPESAYETIRHASIRALIAVGALPALPRCPNLNTEHNGRGEAYQTLRYQVPGIGGGPCKQRGIYLGRATAAEICLLVSRIEMYHGQPNSHASMRDLFEPTIQQLRTQLKLAMQKARSLAEECGLAFAGYELRKKRGCTGDVRHSDAYTDNLSDLADHLCLKVKSPLIRLQELYTDLAEKHQNLDVTRQDRGYRPSGQWRQQRALGAARQVQTSIEKLDKGAVWLRKASMNSSEPMPAEEA